MIVPNDLVPGNYVFDPDKELLSKGSGLRNGMVVLIRDNRILGTNTADFENAPEWIKERARRYNRWAEVSEVYYDYLNERVSFLAVYGDGTQGRRNYAGDDIWFVKRESLPPEPPAETATRESVYGLVWTAVKYHREFVGSEEEAREFVDKITDKIIRITSG